MRALAAKGGVMQITMYNGFLVKDGEATVLDALRHLAHAIEVMGIDHVGIGTDFDGDGGVRGMANSIDCEPVSSLWHDQEEPDHPVCGGPDI